MLRGSLLTFVRFGSFNSLCSIVFMLMNIEYNKIEHLDKRVKIYVETDRTSVSDFTTLDGRLKSLVNFKSFYL